MKTKSPPKKGLRKKQAEQIEILEQPTDDNEPLQENGAQASGAIGEAEETYSYEIKIPKERIAVLIGKEGTVKRDIERQLDIRIEIDSSEGDVTITGKDALQLLAGREIIKAIARGFNPEIALLLLKPDYTLDVINLADAARTPKDLERLKGRIIGAGGKSRRVIEDLTETNISVYGKTVSIIAEIDAMLIARHAIEMLIEGSCHRNVYKWLEKQRKTMRLRRGFGN